MRDGGERRRVEAKRKRGDRRAKEGVGRGIRVSSTRGARGVVLGDDFVDSGRKVDKEILLDIARTASQFGVEGARKESNVVNEREEARADATKGLDDTGDDRFALGGGVAGEFVLFSGGSSEAGSGKGCSCIP